MTTPVAQPSNYRTEKNARDYNLDRACYWQTEGERYAAVGNHYLAGWCFARATEFSKGA